MKYACWPIRLQSSKLKFKFTPKCGYHVSLNTNVQLSRSRTNLACDYNYYNIYIYIYIYIVDLIINNILAELRVKVYIKHAFIFEIVI